jgi:hypothetical protein
MPTSTAFNNFNNSGEQKLLEDLIIEQIQVFGVDMYYLPRSENHYSQLFGFDDQSSYESATLIEMYVNSPGDDFSSSGTFMSKFSDEIRDELSFSIAERTFTKEVTDNYPDIIKPKQGDLVYYPLDKKLFKITFVNTKALPYPMGSLPIYRLSLELFDYSNEFFSTGIDELDVIEKDYSTNILDYAIVDQNGTPLRDSLGNYIVSYKYDLHEITNADNEDLQQEALELLDFTEENPFGEINDQD